MVWERIREQRVCGGKLDKGRLIRGLRGGLGNKGEEGQRKEGVKSGLENKGEVGQR